MSTRIHLPRALTTDIYPAVESSWERYTSTITRYPCGVPKQGTAFGEVSYYEINVAAQYDMMVVQYISGPLRAQTISGTVKGQIQARQSSVDADFCMAMVIKVVTAVGITRGVLLSYFPNTITTELAVGVPVNRHCPPEATALTELAIEEGDRLVIEIGVRSFNTLTTTQYAYITVGDAAAADLPEDETETEYLNPWVEFSDTLAWQVETAYVAAGYMKLCGSCLLSGGGDTENITEYAADGCIQIVGEGVLSSPEALTTAFVASGAYLLGGTGVADSRIPAAYQAAGHIELSGTCQLTSPYVPPVLMISQYEAGGSLALLGSCSLESVLLQVADFMAAGCYSLSGRSVLSVIMPSLRVDAYVAAGCYELHGPSSIVRGPVYAYAADTKIGPCLEITSRARVGFIFPQRTAMAAQGGYVLESPDVPADGVFETLVLTGARSEVSVYSNFKFNSYAKYGGKYYGATQDGIFLLEGDDDAGIQIHTGARIGPTNLGTDREKRLRTVKCGGDCGKALVRVSNENGKTHLSPVRGGRADISRAVQGRELMVEIVDFKSLTHLEIIPLVLAKG
jgi:hypothetical protein